MSNNVTNSEVDKTAALTKTLNMMVETGKYESVVLASADGLPLVTVPAEYDGEATAAIVGLLQRINSVAKGYLGMTEVDEVNVFDSDRVRLVCRHFFVEGKELILAVLVRPDNYYRHMTNQAIRQISNILS